MCLIGTNITKHLAVFLSDDVHISFHEYFPAVVRVPCLVSTRVHTYSVGLVLNEVDLAQAC